MFYSDSRQNNITFYTADWKSEMKMPAMSLAGPCSKLKWPIIILLTLTFVWAPGKLKLLLSVAIISNYSPIIIRRWRPHINNKRNTHRCPIILSQVLLFYFADLGSSWNSCSEIERVSMELIQFTWSEHSPLTKLNIESNQ